MKTTDGPWIVKPGEMTPEGIVLARVVHLLEEKDSSRVEDIDCELVALVPNLADAALVAASREMLSTLIMIHEELNKSKQVIDLGMLNEAISMCVEKIAAEAGETE